MTENDERYGGNKNRWRKTYGYSRKQPRVVQFFDSGSQTSASYDLKSTSRHRDMYILKGVNRRSGVAPFIPFSATTYEEGLIIFNGECEVSYSFIKTFVSTPIVVYTVENVLDDSNNINVFGADVPSLTGSSAATSAPFYGNIRYRAAIPGGPNAASSASTGSMVVFAGQLDITNSIEYTASYSIPTGSLEFRATFHDTGNAEANTFRELDSIGTGSAENSISMETTGKIHFIAYSL